MPAACCWQMKMVLCLFVLCPSWQQHLFAVPCSIPLDLHMCLCRVWFFLAFKEKVVSLITEVERKAKVTFQ